MPTGTCICGAVKFTVSTKPTWMNDCKCTICRKYGTCWAYYTRDTVRLEKGSWETQNDFTHTYQWSDKILDFHCCKTCGCVTYWTSHTEPEVGLNARLFEAKDVEGVEIRSEDPC